MDLPCETCKGSCVNITEAATYGDRHYPRTERPCFACQGRGTFPTVNVDAILTAILAKQGKNKGKLRASMTSPYARDGVNAARSYYVWRLARFHGGLDMTMPCMAGLVVHGDPFREQLDTMSEEVAKTYLGSDMHGALRWGRAFGII